MKAIYADPERLESILSDRYIIPAYQRKYTWADDECNRLWEDLLNFHGIWNNSKNDKYFLGSITVWRASDDKSWEVIDGQQRLITLSLLIKAFLNINSGNHKLLKCLYTENLSNDEVSLDAPLRVRSESLAENDEDFNKIIRDSYSAIEDDPKSQIGKNYKLLKNKVIKWGAGKNNKEIESMLEMLTRNIQILRIKGESMDDALNIFETINDRGKPLDDSDILKVNLYRSVPETYIAQKEFNIRWNALKDHKSIFTIYMHWLKAQEGDADTNTMAPRKFFQDYDKKYNLFKDWEGVMQNLEKIKDIAEENWDMSHSIVNWWTILNDSYPSSKNQVAYWKLPLYVFLCKNVGGRSHEGRLFFEEDIQDEFKKLILCTVKFLIIKGINYQNSGVIRRPSHDMYVAIEGMHKDAKSKYGIDNYLKVYTDELKNNGDLEKFNDRIKDHNEFGVCRKLLVYVGSYLSTSQNPYDFKGLLNQKIDIETIIPSNWEKYENWGGNLDWTQDTHREDIRRLGNLMLLENKLYKATSNSSFKDKKTEYRKSKFNDAIILSKERTDNWTPTHLKERDEEVRDRIIDFVKKDMAIE